MEWWGPDTLSGDAPCDLLEALVAAIEARTGVDVTPLRHAGGSARVPHDYDEAARLLVYRDDVAQVVRSFPDDGLTGRWDRTLAVQVSAAVLLGCGVALGEGLHVASLAACDDDPWVGHDPAMRAAVDRFRAAIVASAGPAAGFVWTERDRTLGASADAGLAGPVDVPGSNAA